MGQYDIPMKYRVVIKGLQTLGLEIKHASNHETATCPTTNRKTTIPRHKEINKMVVGSVIEFLLDNNYDYEEVKRAFKLK